MSLRERNDCTLEALVPKASAIHSSVLPWSTHSRISLMCGLRAMRFFESVMLPILLITLVCPAGDVWKRLIYELLTVPDNILLPKRIFKAFRLAPSFTCLCYARTGPKREREAPCPFCQRAPS